ncbi:MAG: cation transporter [FCB group bacterium]|nr:cation transporter [FCB group bacterium]
MNINNHTDSLPPEERKQRYHSLVKASFIAIGADLFLILLKYLLSNITGSTVLLADAWHSGGDLAVTLMVLTSIVVNNRFKDNPWAKQAEGLVSLLIFVILLTGGINLIVKVFSAQSAGFQLTADLPLVAAIAGTGIAAGIAFKMFRFKRRTGLKHDSIAFTAESVHTFSDFFTTFGVWITLMLGFFGVQIERWMTLIVGLVIIRISFRLLGLSLRNFGYKPRPLSEWRKKLPDQVQPYIDKFFNVCGDCIIKVRNLKNVSFLREDWIVNREKRIIGFQVIVILLLYLATGYYSVQPYQTGVELLFGKVIEQNPPGFHYHAPQPFGKVIKVDTGVAARVESGYRTVWNFEGKEPEAYLWEYAHNQGRYLKMPDEAVTLTGDENLIDVNALCYYRITDPVKYALQIDNPHEILRSLFTYETHVVMGRFHLDSLMASSRGMAQKAIGENLKSAISELNLGMEILDVYLQEAHPPLEVVPQYRSVASARERKDQIIHQATAYANDLIPRSVGQSKSDILSAESYRSERTFSAQGEAENFLLRQKNFDRFRNVQEARLRWETIEKTLDGKKVYIIPSKARKRIVSGELKISDE